MVAVLVIVTVIAVLIVEAVLSRRRRPVESEATLLGLAIDEGASGWTAGFRLPAPFYYHQGHTWVYCASPREAFVGIDDFGRRLLGKDSRVSAPPIGVFTRQGEEAVAVDCEGDRVHLLAPISGEVVAINSRLKQDPGVLHEDPYRRGWVYKIRSRELFKELSNLMRGSLAQRWMEDTRDRLQRRIMLATGSVIQDGGTFVDDLPKSLSREDWRSLVAEFLTDKVEERRGTKPSKTF